MFPASLVLGELESEVSLRNKEQGILLALESQVCSSDSGSTAGGLSGGGSLHW